MPDFIADYNRAEEAQLRARRNWEDQWHFLKMCKGTIRADAERKARAAWLEAVETELAAFEAAYL